MNLEEKISIYQCPEAAATIIKNAKIALIVGISGAGKDTIKKALLERPGFADIISHTTRQPRANLGVMEIDGQDYHFITEQRACQMLEAGEFVEAKYVHGTVYGTSVAEVRQASESGVAITDIDVQGVAEYKALSDKVVAMFIVPPTYDVWLERLRQRYETLEEFEAEWPKRRASAIKELTRALELPYYHCVINDSLDRAVEVVADIAIRPDRFTRKDDEARLVARDLLNSIKYKEAQS